MVTTLFRRVGDIARRGAGDFTWSGQLMGGAGTATLVVRPHGITGQITVGGESYWITPIGDGQQVITRIPHQLQFPEHPPDAQTPPDQSQADISITPCAPDGTEADVVAFYTPAAKEQRASTGGDIESDIQLSIDVSTEVMKNSDAKASLKLVETRELAYQETGSLSPMFTRSVTCPP